MSIFVLFESAHHKSSWWNQKTRLKTPQSQLPEKATIMSRLSPKSVRAKMVKGSELQNCTKKVVGPKKVFSSPKRAHGP